MQEVFGAKKKPRDSPALGFRHSRTHFPSDPHRQQRYIGLCPNKSGALGSAVSAAIVRRSAAEQMQQQHDVTNATTVNRQ
jgi:hypothetical protein